MQMQTMCKGNTETQSADIIADPQSTSTVSGAAAKDKGKTWKCIYCERVFAWPQHLKYHIKTHTGNRAFKCTYNTCEKAFYTLQQREIHVKAHTGDKNFVCGKCAKGFVTAQQLQNHSRTHTGERPFSCSESECGKSFTEYSTLKKHLLTHTGKKPYKCRLCDKAFSQSSTLRTHMKRLHNDAGSLSDSPHRLNGKIKGKQQKKAKGKPANTENWQNAAVKKVEELDNAPLDAKISQSNSLFVAASEDMTCQPGTESVIVVSQPNCAANISGLYTEKATYIERVQEMHECDSDYNLYSEISSEVEHASTSDECLKNT